VGNTESPAFFVYLNKERKQKRKSSIILRDAKVGVYNRVPCAVRKMKYLNMK
jgi:hypothetical protein